MTPPTSRTWAKRGHTPVIKVRGRSQRRYSIAALTCYKPGERSRLIYRPKRHTDHKQGGRRSFTWTEYRDLLIAAHQQLGGPIVLIWDNLNVHKDHRMRAFIDATDWITVYYLPPYAPDLNPVEVSRAGDGLHVWGRGALQRGRRITVGGGSVELYETGRLSQSRGGRTAKSRGVSVTCSTSSPN
ncbi:transposase [Streptomyces sp. NPDC056352]|uniref:transposase n=1 Tax=Streptomyces sp. NPDC056352 TaxID=3345791 RepID=UPI0035DD97C0